jgi:hypothetical protein
VRPQLLHVFIDAADMVLGVGDVALQDLPVLPGGRSRRDQRARPRTGP